jgi:hypothetical protein
MQNSVIRGTLAIVIGALLGGAVGSLIYLSINPFLEASAGPLRETQGLLWNVVPGLTIVGGVVGWLIFGRPRK